LSDYERITGAESEINGEVMEEIEETVLLTSKETQSPDDEYLTMDD
jgi:hypothetical protein